MNRISQSLHRLIDSIGVLVAVPIAAVLFAAPALAGQPDPHSLADDTWISISGTVHLVEPNRFLLDYGDGLIEVEMDDDDRDADAYKLLKGDRVTVSGRVTWSRSLVRSTSDCSKVGNWRPTTS